MQTEKTAKELQILHSAPLMKELSVLKQRYPVRGCILFMDLQGMHIVHGSADGLPAFHKSTVHSKGAVVFS